MAEPITVLARVMYPHLAQPHKFHKDDPDDKLRYSLELVIAQDDQQIETLRRIEQSIIQKDLRGRIPTGDHVFFKEKPNNPNVQGCYVISAKSQMQPKLVDANRQPLLDATEIEDGDWCYVGIGIFGYDKSQPGVTAFLNGVMLYTKGQQKLGVGGGPSTDEMFGNVPPPPQADANAVQPPRPF